MSSPTPRPPTIGVFDSGVGGLSVLRALHRLQSACRLHYVADCAHAPYGERDEAHVIARSLRLTDHLVRHGADLVVVACNTATACAIDALRDRFPALPLVGVEPGVKPAAQASRSRRVAVLATPATLASARFDSLVQRHAPDCEVLRVPCPGLAAAIERGEDARDEIEALLDRFCTPLQGHGVDIVVLGCTHYPFVADRIARRLDPGVALLDTAEAVARQALRLQAEHAPVPTDTQERTIVLQSTGDTAVLERLAHSGLGLDLQARQIDV